MALPIRITDIHKVSPKRKEICRGLLNDKFIGETQRTRKIDGKE